MNVELFVHNVEEMCKIKNVYPTIACRESGAGHSFLSDIKRGRIPSVDKFQQLAQYLGCTTSQLLGEGYIKHVTGTVLPPAESVPSGHWGYDTLFPNQPRSVEVAQNLLIYGYGLRKSNEINRVSVYDFRLRKELVIRLECKELDPGDNDPVAYAGELAGKIYRQSCDLENKSNQTATPKGNGLVVEFAKLFDRLTPEKQNEIIAEMLKRQLDK